jgi:hypothetical protein
LLLYRRVRVTILRQNADGANAEKNETEQQMPVSKCKLSHFFPKNREVRRSHWTYLLMLIGAQVPSLFLRNFSGNCTLLESAL